MAIIIIYIGIAFATCQLANQKGYSKRWWFFIGLLSPIVSLSILFLLKKKLI